MARKPYFGPAGIFSTDDPVADQRQIEAEQYDPSEWEKEEHQDDVEEQPEFIEACGGSVDCSMWFLETIEKDTFESWVERMKTLHQKQCGCNATFEFSHI